MAKKKRLPWNEPRFLQDKPESQRWYYVNRGSVTLCFGHRGGVSIYTMTRTKLRDILAEIGERRGRA